MSENYEYIEEDQIEVDKRRRSKLLAESNIPKDLLRYKWKNYKIDDNEQVDGDGNPIKLKKEMIASRKEALEKCVAYSVNLERMYSGEFPRMSILLTGEKGSGKSVLGSLVLRSFIETLIKDVFFVPFSIFTTDFNGTFEEANNKIIQYCEYSLLMIDEIDAGYFLTPRVKNILSTILTKRALYDNPTIITSKIPYEYMVNIIGLPTYRLLGKKESYYHINILNDRYLKPDELLSPNTRYSRNKALALLKSLNNIIEANKGKKGAGLFGHQLAICLQSAIRSGYQNKKEEEIMITEAMGNITESAKRAAETQQLEASEENVESFEESIELVEEEIEAEKQEILDDLGL